MTLSGLHLTDLGSPVCEGQIVVSRNGKPISKSERRTLCLHMSRVDFEEIVHLTDDQLERDPDSGFYRELGQKRQVTTEILFSPPMQRFLQEQVTRPPTPTLEEACFKSNQSRKNESPSMGSVLYRIQNSENGHYETVSLLINNMEMAVQNVKEGLACRLHGTLKSRGKLKPNSPVPDGKYDINADYQIDAEFLLNAETQLFRFFGKIELPASKPGLLRVFAGDEAQTDLDHLNLKHPLIYNTGGIFALCSEGVHAVHLSHKGMRIQPVQLRGAGWGSVYKSDGVRGRNELSLPGLTFRTLENILHSQSYFDGDVLRAHIPTQQVYAGKFVEDATHTRIRSGKNALNERHIETIAIDLFVDDFGLTMAIDANLSDIIQNSAKADTPPTQGPHYSKTLLIPWEVLICRHFDLRHYLDYWFDIRQKNQKI